MKCSSNFNPRRQGLGGVSVCLLRCSTETSKVPHRKRELRESRGTGRPAGSPPSIPQASRSCGHHCPHPTVMVSWVPKNELCSGHQPLLPQLTASPAVAEHHSPHPDYHRLSRWHPHTPFYPSLLWFPPEHIPLSDVLSNFYFIYYLPLSLRCRVSVLGSQL